MSRIGKKPVLMPANVEVSINDNKEILLKGPKGVLSLTLAPDVDAKMENNEIWLNNTSKSRQSRAIFGLNRSLLANMVVGVTEGYEKKLKINGVGYKAELKGTTLSIAVGLSHIVEICQPEGITFRLNNPQTVSISGIDKELVGRMAAKIRDIRPVEPYNGKGIQYENEIVRRKAGKSGK